MTGLILPKKPVFVRYVRHDVRYPVRYQLFDSKGLCGMCGMNAHFPMCACACVGACVQAGAHPRRQAQSRTYRTHPTRLYKSMSCLKIDATPYPVHTAHKKMMNESARRCIPCTPDNVGEMRALVARWPRLNQLVRDLQAQGLFPGLRGVQITVTGSAEQVAKGLGAVMAKNPQNPAKKD